MSTLCSRWLYSASSLPRLFTGMVLWAVPEYLRERRAAFAELRHRPGFTPPLSLLKPLHGAEPGLEAHLATFFRAGLSRSTKFSSAHAPTTTRVSKLRGAWRRAIRRSPRNSSLPASLLHQRQGRSMELMETAAAHDILVISDSDVRVTPDYLRAVALPFADERVGAVTCPYRGVAAEGGLWARLEAVGMCVEMTAGVLVARLMEGMQFTLGPTMAFRRETIRRMGGFRVTADYCADDFVLGNETFKLGQEVVLSHHAIDHMVINTSLVLAEAPGALDEVDALLAAQGPLRHGAHVQHAFRIAGLAPRVALGHPYRGPGSSLAWSLATRLALSLAVGRGVVGDRSWFGLLVLYPIRDLMGFGFWVASYFSNRILWRGRVFQLLPGGKMRAAIVARDSRPDAKNCHFRRPIRPQRLVGDGSAPGKSAGQQLLDLRSGSCPARRSICGNQFPTSSTTDLHSGKYSARRDSTTPTAAKIRFLCGEHGSTTRIRRLAQESHACRKPPRTHRD